MGPGAALKTTGIEVRPDAGSNAIAGVGSRASPIIHGPIPCGVGQALKIRSGHAGHLERARAVTPPYSMPGCDGRRGAVLPPVGVILARAGCDLRPNMAGRLAVPTCSASHRPAAIGHSPDGPALPAPRLRAKAPTGVTGGRGVVCNRPPVTRTCRQGRVRPLAAGQTAHSSRSNRAIFRAAGAAVQQGRFGRTAITVMPRVRAIEEIGNFGIAHPDAEQQKSFHRAQPAGAIHCGCPTPLSLGERGSPGCFGKSWRGKTQRMARPAKNRLS